MGQPTEEMKRRRVEGSAGGGMVVIELTGLMEVIALPHRSGAVPPERPRVARRPVRGGGEPGDRQGEADARRCCRELTGGLPLPG